MADVFDVAYYILRKQGEMTAMKLQKLVYYSQAWKVVWDEDHTPLFKDRLEAWANGPVSPRLYGVHRGMFMVNMTTFQNLGSDRNLTKLQKETIDAVLDFYGKRTPESLSALTHRESPWLRARDGLSKGQRSRNEITLAAMVEYYGSQ